MNFEERKEIFELCKNLRSSQKLRGPFPFDQSSGWRVSKYKSVPRFGIQYRSTSKTSFGTDINGPDQAELALVDVRVIL